MSSRLSITILMAELLLLGAVGTATAHHITATGTGSYAWSSHPHASACIRDTATDGFSARVDFYRLGSSLVHGVTETRGNGYSRCSGTGATVSLLRACSVIPVLPDSCSGWSG
jgi:hypothetical protein